MEYVSNEPKSKDELRNYIMKFLVGGRSKTFLEKMFSLVGMLQKRPKAIDKSSSFDGLLN